MSTKERKPAVLRDSWRSSSAKRDRSQLWRASKRWGAVIALGFAAGVFFYLLLTPLYWPRTCLVCLTGEPADRPNDTILSEAGYVASKLASQFVPLDVRIPTSNAANDNVCHASSSSDLDAWGDALKNSSLKGSDALIVYVKFSGVVFNGEPYLEIDSGTTDTDRRYPLRSLLDFISGHPLRQS